MDHETFRRFAHEFVDWMADYMGDVERYPVVSRAKPGEIRARLPGRPPQKAESMDRIFADFKEIILPGITHWQHPGWHAGEDIPSLDGRGIAAESSELAGSH